MQYPDGTTLSQDPELHSTGRGPHPLGHVSLGGQPPAAVAVERKLVMRKKHRWKQV